MRIAYLASHYLDPRSPRSWSGLPYYIRRSLEAAGVETVVLQLDDSRSLLRWGKFVYWRARGRRYLRQCDPGLLRAYAQQAERRLDSLAVDAVFAPSTWLFAYLETELPIILWTDACFGGMVDFYASFTQVAPPSLAAGHAAERSALERCARAIYCSRWAADEARAAYGVPAGKLEVVPFAGNLHEPPARAEVREAIDARNPRRCELLFVGVEWKRKGGDIALETLEALLARGRNARLTIVGCRPPYSYWRQLPSAVEVIPFISKETPEGRKRLADLYRRSHFFILPSRAEAFGLVLSEANAFGVPCLTTRVGGLRSVILDGINGQTFELSDRGVHYADYIDSLLADPPRYSALARRAAEEALTRLSWSVSAARVAEILASCAKRPAAGAASAADLRPIFRTA
jgi:glycosyltransferase involved in cell wall biosynthesis